MINLVAANENVELQFCASVDSLVGESMVRNSVFVLFLPGQVLLLRFWSKVESTVQLFRSPQHIMRESRQIFRDSRICW